MAGSWGGRRPHRRGEAQQAQTPPDAKAMDEYEQFAARRREQLVMESLRELEDQANKLPNRKEPPIHPKSDGG